MIALAIIPPFPALGEGKEEIHLPLAGRSVRRRRTGWGEKL